jgi:dienelactone hydrolase
MDTQLRATFSVLDALRQNARSAPPILVARAALDNAWLKGTIDRFVQTGRDSGATLDLLNHPEGRHSFDILDDNARSKQIIRRTLEFLRDGLGP